MIVSHQVMAAARMIKSGGVIAYPTDTIYGLGCLPSDSQAIQRILKIKQRSADKGLILLAANRQQLEPYTAKLDDQDWAALQAPQEQPTTWLVPAANGISPLVSGKHSTVAVRITRHTSSSALCVATGGAIISTSANLSGMKPTHLWKSLDQDITENVDLVLADVCGDHQNPSRILELGSKQILRV